MATLRITLTQEEIKTAVSEWLTRHTDYEDWDVVVSCEKKTEGDMRESYDVWYARADAERKA